MAPKGRVETDDVDEPTIADLVRSHAARHAANSWVQTDVTLGGKPRGLMSPRLAVFVDDPVLRHQVFSERQNVLDDLTRAQAILDMRLLAALGEPSYWSRSRQDQPLQDDGASRLEMQPRNHGSEFVGSRLRKLATTVARPQTSVWGAVWRCDRLDHGVWGVAWSVGPRRGPRGWWTGLGLAVRAGVRAGCAQAAGLPGTMCWCLGTGERRGRDSRARGDVFGSGGGALVSRSGCVR